MTWRTVVRICMRGVLLLIAGIGTRPALLASAQATPASSSPTDANAIYLPTLTFDVASIHESPPADSFIVSFQNPAHSSLLRLTNNTVMHLIAIAYGLDFFNIEGGPDWVRRTNYLIEARSDSDADEKLARLSDGQARLEKQHMLQVLLADRFQLKMHTVTKEGTNYALVVAKKGSKLSTDPIPASTEEKARLGDRPAPPLAQYGDGHLGYQFIGHRCTMKRLAEVLTGQMQAPVLDQTGLTGTYDFTLKYRGSLPPVTESRDPGSQDTEAWPPMITALPEQLGLRLEPVKGTVEVLVIDHIEKPSAN